MGVFIAVLVLLSNSLHLVQFYRSPLLIGNLMNKRTVHSYVPMFLLIVNKSCRGKSSVLWACVLLEK